MKEEVKTDKVPILAKSKDIKKEEPIQKSKKTPVDAKSTKLKNQNLPLKPPEPEKKNPKAEIPPTKILKPKLGAVSES